jgi:hypothetical protein
VTAHETLLAVRAQIVKARYDLRDSPTEINLHPIMWEELLLDEDLTHRFRPWEHRVDALFGLRVVEDRRLPDDVIVLRGPHRRVTVLRQVETTQYRAIVRDGVRKAHPWLRLPDPVPPAKGERWVSWVFNEDRLRYRPSPYDTPPRFTSNSHMLDASIYALPFRRPESFVSGTWS